MDTLYHQRLDIYQHVNADFEALAHVFADSCEPQEPTGRLRDSLCFHSISISDDR